MVSQASLAFVSFKPKAWNYGIRWKQTYIRWI